jgi:hypothetical protein
VTSLGSESAPFAQSERHLIAGSAFVPRAVARAREHQARHEQQGGGVAQGPAGLATNLGQRLTKGSQ